MTPKLETVYQPHLALAYTCVDRIYLRAYVPILQTCGGFRCWAERLRPGEPVTQNWLRSFARRFHTNVKTYAEEHGIPIVEPRKGQRKHLLADAYREAYGGREGVYLIIKATERAKLFTSKEPTTPSPSIHRNLECRKGFVTHYTFYIVDKHWGPMSVVLSSHPPFSGKVFLNGHYWAQRRARAKGIAMETQTNAFVGADDPARLQKICDSLSESEIRRVADRWIYRVLPVLSYKQRHDTRFRYEWSLAQMEISHNLVFRENYPVSELFHRHIDLNRRFFGPKSISTVFGKKRPGRPSANVSIYQSYDSVTVFRVKHGRAVIKQYDKHQRILRTEVVANDTGRFGVRKLLTNFSALRAAMTSALERFQALQHGVADSTLNRGELAALAKTSELGLARVPGIRLDNERMTTVLRLLGRLATEPRGFTAGRLRELYEAETGHTYKPSQATYDLRKLRAKRIIEAVGRSRRYVFTAAGAQMAVTLYKLHDLLIAPVLRIERPDPSLPNTKSRRGPKREPPPHNLRTLLAKHAGCVTAVAAELKRDLSVVRRWIRREDIILDLFRNPVQPPELDAAYRDIETALARLPVALGLQLAA